MWSWFKNCYRSCFNDERIETEVQQEISIPECVDRAPAVSRSNQNSSSENTKQYLDVFLDNLYDGVKIKKSQQEMKDIYCAVENTVSHLLHQLSRLEPLLKSAEVVRTGSCYDDTKILRPDEFDFLAVIECLSGDNAVLAIPSRECADGFAHAVLTDKTSRWQSVILDNTVEACRTSKSLREMFRKYFHLVLLEELSEKFCLQKQTGKLILDGFAVAINGPQCNVRVKWLSYCTLSEILEIDVDITPAIKCKDITMLLNSTDVGYTELFEQMKTFPEFYLIPRPDQNCNNCFKIVFTQLDQYLVSKLSDPHKKGLMVLKYLSCEILKYQFHLKKLFSSFAMKMAVFHHSVLCDRTSSSVGECLIQTLAFITDHLHLDPPNLPSVFIKRRNVWKHHLDTHELSKARASLQKVKELFESIRDGKFKSCDFMDLKDKLIYLCKHSIEHV